MRLSTVIPFIFSLKRFDGRSHIKLRLSLQPDRFAGENIGANSSASNKERSIHMKARLIATIMLFGVVVLHAPSASTAQNPPPGTSTGQKIGTIVSTAITTALPGFKTILDLLPKKNNGQPKDNVRPDEVKAAVETARTQLLSAALDKLKPVNEVSGELLTLSKFLTPTVVANENLIRIQTRLATTSQPFKDNFWQAQNADWAVAKARLNTLNNITDADIAKVRDLWLRNKLSTIKVQGTDQVIRLDDALKNKTVAQIPDLLKDLIGLLSDVSMAVGYELSDLQNDLGELGKWGGAQGGGPAIPDHFITEDQTMFKARLDQKYHP
jgi:hypothetical protein